MEAEKLKQVLEAALMITESPLTLDRMMALFEDDEAPPKRDKVRRTLEELEVDYEHSGIELVEVASGYRFQARAEMAPWMNRLFEERRPKYSRALLETIAIIAYRQPITRGEIESIRGVAVSTGIIRTLLEREWVRVVGHRDVPGKPAVYATTKTFLDYFNLASIDQLPSLAELKDFDDINADLFRDQNINEGGEGAANVNDSESSSAEPANENDDAAEGLGEPGVSETAEHELSVVEPVQDETAQGRQETEIHVATEPAIDIQVDADSHKEPTQELGAASPTINRIQSSTDDQSEEQTVEDEITVQGQSN